MDEFDIYATDMDSECVNQDFDDIDLYAEHTKDENNTDDDCDILFN